MGKKVWRWRFWYTHEIPRWSKICKLVGSYLLKKLWKIVDKKPVGLYRDDGLAFLQNLWGPQVEWKHENIIEMFKIAGFLIVSFLDLEFNLNNGTYQPIRKPGNTPVYINQKSHNPPVVLKQLLKSIAKRISDFSSDENIFS